MVSLLESKIKDLIYAGFKGQLLTGTLLRTSEGTSVDSYGDPTGTTTTEYTMEGIVDTYNAFYKTQAGIPDSDVKILIIAGSLSVTPQKDDYVEFRDVWYKVRQVSKDPANATWELQAFEALDFTTEEETTSEAGSPIGLLLVLTKAA